MHTFDFMWVNWWTWSGSNLRAAGASWKVISLELSIGVGTACRVLKSRSKNLSEFALASA